MNTNIAAKMQTIDYDAWTWNDATGTAECTECAECMAPFSTDTPWCPVCCAKKFQWTEEQMRAAEMRPQAEVDAELAAWVNWVRQIRPLMTEAQVKEIRDIDAESREKSNARFCEIATEVSIQHGIPVVSNPKWE